MQADSEILTRITEVSEIPATVEASDKETVMWAVSEIKVKAA